MSKTLFLFLSIITSAYAFTQNLDQNSFELSGRIINSKYTYVYLFYKDKSGKDIEDSCRLENEYFHFNGNISEPTFAVLRNSEIMEDSNNPNINDIYLVPTNMTAFISYNHFKDMKMTGSKTNDSFDSLKLQWSKVNKQSDSAEEIFSRIESKYIGTHPNSFVSARELAYYKRTWKLDKVQQLYNNLNDKVKNSWSGKDVKVAITEIEENSPGKKAKDFRTTDVNGKVIDLSNFRNGYVLLDFWASWCEPCRKSTPHLIQLYKKYRNRGFSVIGVSVDHDVNAWKKAIQQDSINIWYNILSTSINPKTSKDSKSVNDKFGVKVFPTKILIDKNGTIIGRFTGADDDIELDKKLSTIFRG